MSTDCKVGTEARCPNCGPTTLVKHPALSAVLRCHNCREWLHTNEPAASRGADQ